jgi:predicted RNA binding protein YcfA (HicA-like mRNA interferase family)
MNPIDYSRLRSLTARELVAALQRQGFIPARQRENHHRYEHPDGRKVTVPFSSPSDTFLLKTLKERV